ncbi:hypothetical protein LCGC14_0654690 [marine sediment metagenome]|uniref:HTH crp-type domain-containing protein n=1 Tax=marine sediment metagenome TaxID=412755 RepID=A0A0F9RF78_9ZZZZ|nr:hypothetical protein [Candidatus Aminicenantes bacterium]
MEKKEYITKLENKIKEVLCEIPSISIEKTKKDVRISPLFQADLIIEIFLNNKKKNIVVEIKTVGEPRYIRSAVQQLSSYLRKTIDVYGIIAAPYISEKTGEVCKEANIGYIDLSGNCFLSFDSIYIEKKNFISIVSGKRELKSLFSKKTTRLLRVLLARPEEIWTQISLSNESNVSIGLTNRVIKRLYDLEYIDLDQNKKISLKNPSKLLDLWRENYSYLNNEVQGFYSPLSRKEFEERLIEYMSKKNTEGYAFTLFTAGELISPFVRTNQTFFYFSDNIEKLIKETGLKPVTSGANVIILKPYDEGVFYGIQKVQKRNVVSNIQLYLDLYNYKGRGREQAEYLREKAIKL